MPREIWMVLVNSGGSVFVKDYDFFRSQGGCTEGWGLHWTPVMAGSVEEARSKGCALPGARPESAQAWNAPDFRGAGSVWNLCGDAHHREASK